jgi:ligand-binding sensor domain-containing protein
LLRSILLASSIVLLFTSCLQLAEDVITEGAAKEPEWFYLARKDGLAEDTVLTMMKDSQGYFWFGHYNKGITRWDGESEFIKISQEQGLSDNWIYRIVEAPDGKIWVATNKGYDIIEGSTVVTSEYYNFEFTDIVFPEPGSVWLSCRIGIYVFSDAGDSLISDNECQYCAYTMKLLVDSEGNVWVGSLQDIRRYNASIGYTVDKRYFIYPRENYPYVYINEIYEDENNTIFGGSVWGAFNTFSITDSEPEFFDFSTASIAGVGAITTYNNQLWIGTFGVGVIQTNGTSSSILYNELPSPVVRDFVNDGQSIWIATFKGVAKYTAP